MSLLLAARCSDGVALVGDRKATYGYRAGANYKERKLEQDGSVVWGAAGTLDVLTEIRNALGPKARSAGAAIDPDSFKFEVGKKLRERNIAWATHSPGRSTEMLLAFPGAPARLFWVPANGDPEESVGGYVLAIGSGAPFAQVYLRNNPTTKDAMQEFIVAAYAAILWVQRGRWDDGVGVGTVREEMATVFRLPHGAQPEEIKDADLEGLAKLAEGRLAGVQA